MPENLLGPDPNPARIRPESGCSGKISVGSEFSRAAGKFVVSDRASVGQAENFRPDVQPCRDPDLGLPIFWLREI